MYEFGINKVTLTNVKYDPNNKQKQIFCVSPQTQISSFKFKQTLF